MRAQLEKRALKYLALGKYDKAIEEYKRLIEEGHKDPEIFNSLGDVYLRKGDIAKALQNYWIALERFEKEGLPENAFALAKKISRFEDSKRVYLKLAELSSALGYHDEAVNYLNECLDRGIRRNEVDQVMATFKKIASEISKDVINQPRFERLFSRLQQIVEGFGDISITEEETHGILEEKTLEEIEAEGAVDVSTAEKTEKAAEIAVKEERKPKRAIRVDKSHLLNLLLAMKERLSSAPLSIKNPVETGKELIEMGLYSVAIPFLQKALQTSESPSIYALLGRAFLNSGEIPMALLAFERGLEIAKTPQEKLELLYWKGLAHHMRGEVKESLNLLRQAYLIDSEYMDISNRIAEISGVHRRKG